MATDSSRVLGKLAQTAAELDFQANRPAAPAFCRMSLSWIQVRCLACCAFGHGMRGLAGLPVEPRRRNYDRFQCAR
ncbi:hypothetical protein TMRH483_00039 [Qipengyuania sp. 483]